MGKRKNKKADPASTPSQEAEPATTTPTEDEEEKKVEIEETKTAAATSDSENSTSVKDAASASDEVLISDTESVGDTEEQKIEEQVKAINLNAPAASQDQSEYTEEEEKKAEAFKTAGNEAFKAKKFTEAAEQYTEAIFCKIPPEKKAVLYCNRSFSSLKLEENQLALFDACEAIKLDPTNVKGYYRKGQAYVTLRQMKMAVLAFKEVCKLQPQNKDAREKYEFTLKAHKAQLLAQAIVHEEAKVVVDPESVFVEDSYTGPRLESIDDVSPEWVVSLMEHQRERKTLHKKYATMIIQKATEIFEPYDSLVEISIDELEEITVCGDIHGQYYDLMNIFKINGNPSEENPYLFNGDFIDRGSFSVEVIMLMLAWKVCFPQHFFMSRGNHEAKQLNKMYGFEGEVKAKYDVKTYDLFSQLFCHLPLAHCINKKVMVCHGGLYSKDGVKLRDIKEVHRKREPGDEGIMVESLWSDPCDLPGRHPSKRGVGVMFGPDVAERFLNDNNLTMLVRSHEVKPEGYEYQKGGKVLTIFSAPNYCDQMGNKGAYVRFQGADMRPQITSFEKVDHPKVPPMAYANSWGSFF